MEQVISKAALKNILTAAGPDVIDMDDDTKKGSYRTVGTL